MFLINVFAINRIGAIAVPINTSFKESELEYILNKNNIKMLVMSKGYSNNNYEQVIGNVLNGLKKQN